MADVLQAASSASGPTDFSQEYFLAGSVLDGHKDALMPRLVAISDAKRVPFFEHEIVLGLRKLFVSLDGFSFI